MKPAQYIAAGEFEVLDWRHFALNIPYYTHFTSPIRRYLDIIVHRLLEGTLDESIETFPLSSPEINDIANHCNDKRMKSKEAQDRSDRVFLSLYLISHPIKSIVGIVVGVGEKTFTTFITGIGIDATVFLDEHRHLDAEVKETKRWIKLKAKDDKVDWKELDIKLFSKIMVSCECKRVLTT